jgi:hypothetical protein
MKLYSSNGSFKRFHFLETSESPIRTAGCQYPRCPIHGERVSGLARPNTRPHVNPTERPTQPSWMVRRTFSTHPDPVYGLDIPTQPRVAGEAGGKLIHKLARATHGTLVPWSNPSSRPVGRAERRCQATPS